MKKVIAPIGFPGSGKSTWIKTHRAEYPGVRSCVISGDTMRLMFNEGDYSFSEKDTEVLIRTIIGMVNTLIQYYDVVYIDEYYVTYNRKARDMLYENLYQSIIIEFPFVNTPLATCIYRRVRDDREEDTSRWPQVLLEMVKEFEPPNE